MQRLLFLMALLLAPVWARAQAQYEAQRAPLNLTVGGSFTYFDAAYAGNTPMGVSSYVDFSPVLFDHLGVEGEGRWLLLNATQGFREYSYLAGPVFRFSLGDRAVHPYVKALAGEGIIDFPNHLAYGRYFAVAMGGGAEVPLSRRVRVRLDYEYQIWPDAPGIPGQPGNALKPNGVSGGLSYRVF